MKKLLSLVLVLAMVLGLTVPAFAGGGIGVQIDGTDVSVGTVTNASITAGTVTFADSNPKKLTLNGATIVGDATPAILTTGAIEIEMTGDNTVTGKNAASAIVLQSGNLTFSGNGTLIAHGSGGDSTPAIALMGGTVTLPEGYKAVGSTSKTETVIANMTDAEFNTNNHTFMVGEAMAQTVAIIPVSAPESNTATIKAIKEEPKLAYNIVIPQSVTDLTEENHTDVQLGGEKGEVSIEVTTDNSKTKVYYTVDLDNATLSDGTNTITTSYTYAQGGEYKDLTKNTKVLVYDNKTVKSSTIKVSADNDEWTKAPSGEYSATLTFNFTTVEFGTTCDVDLTAHRRIMQIVKIEDGIVTCDELTYDEGVLVSKLAERTTVSKGNMDKMLLEYAVGDCLHIIGKTFVKCTAPASHELDYERVAFTVYNGVKTKVYAVPTGTTYEFSDGKLYVNCDEYPISDEDLTWTFNGAVLTDGTTGTITDGGLFNGESYQ